MALRSISKLCGSLSGVQFLGSGFSLEYSFGLVSLERYGTYRITNVTLSAQFDWRYSGRTFRGTFPSSGDEIQHNVMSSVHVWAASTQQVKNFMQESFSAFPVTFNGNAIANQAAWNAAPLVAQDIDQDHTNNLVCTPNYGDFPPNMPVNPSAFAMTKVFAHGAGDTPAAIPTAFVFNSTADYLLLYSFSLNAPVGQFLDANDYVISAASSNVSFNLERIA